MGPDIVAIWMARILLAVVVTFLLVWTLRRVGGGLTIVVDWLDGRLQKRGRGLVVGTVEVVSVDAISGFFRSIVGTLRIVAYLAILYSWLVVVAWSLDASHRVFDVVVQPLVSAVTTVGVAILAFIPNLAMLVVIVALARFSTRVIAVLSDAVAERRLVVGWLDPELAALTRRIATILIWATALVMLAPYLPGSESRAFLGVSITLAVLVAFGGNSVTSNLLSGLVLAYARAYHIGDRVKVGSVDGTVLALGVFTTRVRTDAGELVIVPNAVVQSAPIWNYTRDPASAGPPPRRRSAPSYTDDTETKGPTNPV